MAPEILIGVLESKGWKDSAVRKTGATRLWPGDVILRLGAKEDPDALHWPFAGGLQAVQRYLKRWGRFGSVELRIERLMEEIEVLVDVVPPKSLMGGKWSFVGVTLGEGPQHLFLQLGEQAQQESSTSASDVQSIITSARTTPAASPRPASRPKVRKNGTITPVPNPTPRSSEQGHYGSFSSLSGQLLSIDLGAERLTPAGAHIEVGTESIASPLDEDGSAPLPLTMYSLVVLPRRIRSFEVGDVSDSVDRALAWLAGAEVSGIPISLASMQTDVIPVEANGGPAADPSVCGWAASALSDHPDHLARLGSYTINLPAGVPKNTRSVTPARYHHENGSSGLREKWDKVKGMAGRTSASRVSVNCLSIVRAVRLWFMPLTEVQVEVHPGPQKVVGLELDRMAQGFICVSAVLPGSAAATSGVDRLLTEASRSRKRLTIMRVDNARVVPTLMDYDSSVHCSKLRDLIIKLTACSQESRSVKFGLALA